MNKTYGTVLTYGTFDLIHVGHIRLFQRLSSIASKLIVACSTDEFNKVKGKMTVIPFDQRVEMLESCRYVDQVIAERNWDQKRTDIVKFNVDLFAMGDDWEGKFDELADLCDILYLPRTQNISTTELKALVQKMRLPSVKEAR